MLRLARACQARVRGLVGAPCFSLHVNLLSSSSILSLFSLSIHSLGIASVTVTCVLRCPHCSGVAVSPVRLFMSLPVRSVPPVVVWILDGICGVAVRGGSTWLEPVVAPSALSPRGHLLCSVGVGQSGSPYFPRGPRLAALRRARRVGEKGPPPSPLSGIDSLTPRQSVRGCPGNPLSRRGVSPSPRFA